MPDLTLCSNHFCPSAKNCWRHEAKPVGRQPYATFDPGREGKCREFVAMSGKAK